MASGSTLAVPSESPSAPTSPRLEQTMHSTTSECGTGLAQAPANTKASSTKSSLATQLAPASPDVSDSHEKLFATGSPQGSETTTAYDGAHDSSSQDGADNASTTPPQSPEPTSSATAQGVNGRGEGLNGGESEEHESPLVLGLEDLTRKTESSKSWAVIDMILVFHGIFLVVVIALLVSSMQSLREKTGADPSTNGRPSALKMLTATNILYTLTLLLILMATFFGTTVKLSCPKRATKDCSVNFSADIDWRSIVPGVLTILAVILFLVGFCIDSFYSATAVGIVAILLIVILLSSAFIMFSLF